MHHLTARQLALVLVTSVLTACAAPRTTAPPPTPKAQTHIEQGRQYLDQGLLDSALAEFGLALEENPNLTEAHLGMGTVYRQRQDFDRAESAYGRAASIDPTNFDAQYYLGLMRQMLGRVQESITAYLRALAIRPDSVEANRDLASAYLQLSRPGEALAYARRAVELDPDDQAAWTNLAATHTLLKRYEDAVDAYRQAAELGELPDPVLLGLADAHLKLGNYQRAVNVLQSLLRRSPNADGYERLGYAQFKLRQFEQALASYRNAVELDSDNTAALNGVGATMMTLYIRGDRQNAALHRDAIAAWRRSIRLRANQPQIMSLLSRYSRL